MREMRKEEKIETTIKAEKEKNITKNPSKLKSWQNEF